jgi:sugar phosphate isomerase/epimerase
MSCTSSRRSFLRSVVSGLPLALAASRLRGVESLSAAPRRGIALGLDNYAVRAMGWKAPALVDYAASLNLDVLLISDLDAYESLAEPSLREVRRRAEDRGVQLYAGSWSICPTSPAFKPTWGTAEEHLRLGLRVAATLGSPVFRVVLGTRDDRKTPGGIAARIADTVAVLRACRSQALDSGVKIALENHAGDLHSWELRDLIEQAGVDLVGANFDSGNAAWTLEDPLDAFERLGPVTICSSLRDVMAWSVPEGAAIQWTAAGEGLIDWRALATRWTQLCPRAPVIIETISGFARTFPHRTDAFWTHYDRRPDALARFESLVARGHPVETFKAPAGNEGRPVVQAFQKSELERSLAYLRQTVGLGLKGA